MSQKPHEPGPLEVDVPSTCAVCETAVWTVDEFGMLRHRGADGFSSAFIADCLSGEDEGRITAEDVELLFALVKGAVHA